VYIYNCSPGSATGTGTGAAQDTPHQQQIYSNQSIYQNLAMMSGPHQNGSGSEFETYDIPKPATPVPLNYDSPRSGVPPRTPTCGSSLGARFESLKSVAASIEEESYDVPRPLISGSSILQQQMSQMTPSSSASSLLTNDSLSLSFSSSNRSSLVSSDGPD